ncbi:MAG TPA: fumarylacetoacetate hydrolase family protein [Terriglobales bacterium]|nr:fumarylacetoacetate hydrolase family protein [Terriglobales bacterium]
MKLALYDDYRPGAVAGDRIVDLGATVGAAVMALDPPRRMGAIIAGFDRLRGPMAAAAAAGPGQPLAAVRLRAPMPRPGKMLFGLGNYRENIQAEIQPLGLYLKSPTTILDPGGTVVLPRADATIFHHEAELGFIIGKGGKDIPLERALDHVFGYTGIIDVSARGLGTGVGFIDKSQDTFCPMGPWIVTADEIPDPHRLDIKLWENGQPRQDYNTSDIEHPIPEIIAWASQIATLEPGDVFACGTNHQGLGPMQDGETCSLEISGIGRLTVTVSDPLQRRWPFEIDRGVGQAVRQWKRTGIFPKPGEMFQTKRIS